MSIDDAIVEFGFDCKVRKLSEKTVANYGRPLEYYSFPIGWFCVPFAIIIPIGYYS